MRSVKLIAALYDIHGNLPALEAVVDEVRKEKVDMIVIGGDVVPGPMSHECISYLRDLDIPAQFISGNGEREVLAWKSGIESSIIPPSYREAMRWVAAQIDTEDEHWLASWPLTIRINVEGIGEVLFCHATPRSDTEIFTRLTSEDKLIPVFKGFNTSLVICGHTHMQFDRVIGEVRVVNAGSVGMPFGKPGAYWLLIGPGIELRCTSFDLEKAADRIRKTNYPQAEEFAANNILRPPDEEAILEMYAKAELK